MNLVLFVSGRIGLFWAVLQRFLKFYSKELSLLLRVFFLVCLAVIVFFVKKKILRLIKFSGKSRLIVSELVIRFDEYIYYNIDIIDV